MNSQLKASGCGITFKEDLGLRFVDSKAQSFTCFLGVEEDDISIVDQLDFH